MKPIGEPLMFDIEGGSSASEGIELAGFESLEGKINSAFLFIRYCIALWRHLGLKISWSCQGESGRFGGMAVSLIQYVSALYISFEAYI